MSFQPPDPQQRPRSTPIPDGDGFSAPPPTPAQFLRGQDVPWTPKPGRDINEQLGFQQPGPLASVPLSTRSGIRVGMWVFVIAMFAVAAAVGLVIYSKASDIADDAFDQSDVPPITFQLPSIPEFTVPTFTVPDLTVATVPPLTVATVPQITATTVLAEVPSSTAPGETTTLPTPPPTSAPALPPSTVLPNGATSVYAEAAARVVTDQLDLGMAGEPTLFTQIVLLPDSAVATAQDPANPTGIIAGQWLDGQVYPAEVTSTGGSGDFANEVFTTGEVNWEVITGLVALAPSVLGLPDGQVTSISIDRVGVGSPPPVVIDVYVEGPSGKGYVEASATGEILSSGPL